MTIGVAMEFRLGSTRCRAGVVLSTIRRKRRIRSREGVAEVIEGRTCSVCRELPATLWERWAGVEWAVCAPCRDERRRRVGAEREAVRVRRAELERRSERIGAVANRIPTGVAILLFWAFFLSVTWIEAVLLNALLDGGTAYLVAILIAAGVTFWIFVEVARALDHHRCTSWF